MAEEREGILRCPDTGLTVPECSCRNCLEAMLEEFSPELLAGEIRIRRVHTDDSAEHREAA